jgi:superfamily II DNA or RNA helicase
MRTLRSKKLRKALFDRHDGKCAICGGDLREKWHADHVVPWSTTKRTNLFEMQPTCVACNLKKGRNVADRRNQAEATQRATDIARGAIDENRTIADSTPGSGKSRIATNYARVMLNHGIVRHVIWGCPRKALIEQSHETWLKERLPAKALTTVHYQNLASEMPVLLQRCKHEPTLFIADELQYLHDYDPGNGTWDKNSQALFDASAQYLGMSGTLFSSRSGELLGVKYRTGEEMSRLYDGDYRSNHKYPEADIRYDLRDALSDGAVIPFEISASLVDFRTSDTSESIGLYTPESDDYKRNLLEILERESTWKPIVDMAVSQWKEYRRTHYKSVAIFVVATQKQAREVARHLRSCHRVECTMAISDEDNAYDQIEALKSKKFDSLPRALVTVAMAAVGLDIPSATHMVYLSNYRFWGFMLQAWARVSRVCYDSGLSPNQQLGYIYTVKDPRMDKFVDWIKSQTPKGFGTTEGPPPPRPEQEDDRAFIEETSCIGNEFDSSDLTPAISGDRAKRVRDLVLVAPMLGALPKPMVEQLAEAIDVSRLQTATIEKPSLDLVKGTAAHKRKAMRKAVDVLVKAIAARTSSEQSHVRNDLQQGCSITEFNEEGLVSLICRAASLLLRHDPQVESVSIRYDVKPDWDDSTKASKQSLNRDFAATISDIFSQLGIPLTCRERRRG